MINKRVCKKCGVVKNINEFSSLEKQLVFQTRIYFDSKCKECRISIRRSQLRKSKELRDHRVELGKKYRKIPEALVYYRDRARYYRKHNPEIVKAQDVARRIPITSNCIVCDSSENRVRHHYDYSKPSEIVIMCKTCHHLLHSKVKNIVNITFKHLIPKLKSKTMPNLNLLIKNNL